MQNCALAVSTVRKNSSFSKICRSSYALGGCNQRKQKRNAALEQQKAVREKTIQKQMQRHSHTIVESSVPCLLVSNRLFLRHSIARIILVCIQAFYILSAGGKYPDMNM